jgi:type I restriction enzyme S subunit
MNNVSIDGTLNFEKIRYVPTSAARIDNFLLADGDVLFNATNSANLVGKTALVRDLTRPFVFSNHFIRLRTDAGKLTPGFLARWLTAQQRSGRFEFMCNRWVNQASVRREDLLGLTIPLPPVSEQHRIAAILDKADALRTMRRDAIAKLALLSQSVFLEMFGDPVMNPKGWPTRSLDATTIGLKRGPFGGALKKEIFVSEGYWVYEQQHAIYGDFSRARYFIDEHKFDEMRDFAVSPGDLIVSCSGTMGRVAVVPPSAADGVINQALLRITPNPEIVRGEVLADILRSDRMKAHLFGISRGSGLKNFPPMQEVRALQIINPPLAVQIRYLEIIRRICELKSASREAPMEALFSGLQDRAFAGSL